MHVHIALKTNKPQNIKDTKQTAKCHRNNLYKMSVIRQHWDTIQYICWNNIQMIKTSYACQRSSLMHLKHTCTLQSHINTEWTQCN